MNRLIHLMLHYFRSKSQCHEDSPSSCRRCLINVYTELTFQNQTSQCHLHSRVNLLDKGGTDAKWYNSLLVMSLFRKTQYHVSREILCV